MSLNWNSKTQIFECLVKQSSDLDVCSIDRVLYRENFLGKNIFFNWDSLHARLNGHCKAWSYKKRKNTKILRHTGNLFRKNLQLKNVY